MRVLRAVHSLIGCGELACLCQLWLCAIRRRRSPWLGWAVCVLGGEAAALVIGKGCPFGILQRRAGDDVPMFELWLGPKLAPFVVPGFTLLCLGGLALLLVRPPQPVDSPAP